jgi:hypothetical protein
VPKSQPDKSTLNPKSNNIKEHQELLKPSAPAHKQTRKKNSEKESQRGRKPAESGKQKVERLKEKRESEKRKEKKSPHHNQASYPNPKALYLFVLLAIYPSILAFSVQRFGSVRGGSVRVGGGWGRGCGSRM